MWHRKCHAGKFYLSHVYETLLNVSQFQKLWLLVGMLQPKTFWPRLDKYVHINPPSLPSHITVSEALVAFGIGFIRKKNLQDCAARNTANRGARLPPASHSSFLSSFFPHTVCREAAPRANAHSTTQIWLLQRNFVTRKLLLTLKHVEGNCVAENDNLQSRALLASSPKIITQTRAQK